MTSPLHSPMPSPLLSLPGAVAGDGVDAPVAAHYGSFNLEQRALENAEGFVDLSHRDVLRIEGPDRLTWLHSLTTQHLESLAPGITLPGLVRHAHLSDRAPTYHSVRDHEHFHLVCRNCHQVISVAPGVLDPLLARLSAEFAFEADIGHLTVFGRCLDCPPDTQGESPE